MIVRSIIKTAIFGGIYFFCLSVFANETDENKLFIPTGNITKHDNSAPRWVFDFKAPKKGKKDLFELRPKQCKMPERFKISTDDNFNNLPIHKYSISVSNEFFACELKNICNKVSQDNTNLKTIYIIDLRQEPHLFWDGVPVSYRTPHNRHVVGLNDPNQIKEKEEELARNVKSGTTVGYVQRDESGDCSKASGICEYNREYKLSRIPVVQREEEVVASYCNPSNIKVVYKRFPITDHSPALLEQLERYLNFLKTVNFENSHIYIHCKGGKGRTSTFFSITQKFLFPDMSMDQILKQQYAFGGSNLIYKAKKSWKNHLSLKRYNTLKCLDKLKIIDDVSAKKKDFIGMPEVEKCWRAQYDNDKDY